MRKIIMSAIVATALMGGSVYANTVTKKGTTVQEVSQNAVKQAKQDAKSHQAKLIQEAIDSLKFAHEAYTALVKKDSKAATQKLEKALGKLEVILSADKAPKLLPIDNVVAIHEFVGSSKEVKILVDKAKMLLDDGKVQEARALLAPMQSEIDITVVSLPLVSYPDALKLAAKYVHSNKIDEAKKVLGVALSSFTEVTQIIPIPLLTATDLIAAASETAAKDSKHALLYLDGAAESLRVAEALGYISRSETTYKMLQDKIVELKKEIEGPNKPEKLFRGLKAKLKEFGEKIFSPKK